MKLTAKERKQVAIKCIKDNAASEVKRAFLNNYENYYVETSLAALQGIRSTIFFVYGKKELYNFVDNCTNLIISRVSVLPEFITEIN